MPGSCTACAKLAAARSDRCGAGCAGAATGALTVVRQEVEQPGASSGVDEGRKAAGMNPKKHRGALLTVSAAARRRQPESGIALSFRFITVRNLA